MLHLLSCLNLSYNKFRSFTDWEPLVLLKSLEELNISHNEIGVHCVDTTRYVHSSLFSRTEGNDCNLDCYATEHIQVADTCEAVFLFKNLQLRKLDIAGNAVANENLRSLLVKVLPKLQWLDGEAVDH
ncbi:hypothetical protein AQUCO_00400386v1 [Aquilegia coerulea]|uniref:U2A'/phosphoprotein 32 family A C-terminal domain-containing protein n=1 Tax=Aquilegia coerulea TaxID=218851 RepID=A0A2G5EUX9_AQUCA|nr:hypothetical protein AQUCO_00400386v1 [Aquilegia coerulea]